MSLWNFFVFLIQFIEFSDAYGTWLKFALPALHFSKFEGCVMCYCRIEWNSTVVLRQTICVLCSCIVKRICKVFTLTHVWLDFQNWPGNLATAMRVSIDIAVRRCEVRKVMQLMQPDSIHLAHHYHCHWYADVSFMSVLALPLGLMVEFLLVLALMPTFREWWWANQLSCWGIDIVGEWCFLWGVSGWVVHVLRCFGEVGERQTNCGSSRCIPCGSPIPWVSPLTL